MARKILHHTAKEIDDAVTGMNAATERINRQNETLQQIADQSTGTIDEKMAAQVSLNEENIDKLTQAQATLKEETEGSIEAIEQKVHGQAVLVDIDNYRDTDAVLPLNGAYVFRGTPVHGISGHFDATGQDFIAFCFAHEAYDHADHSIRLYVKSGNDYKYSGVFDTSDAETPLEKYIAQCFSANIATQESDGLMSAKDKKTLDGMKTEIDTLGENVSELEREVPKNIEGGVGELDLTDVEGYVIGRFENGHFKTKNFDSSKVATTETIDKLRKDMEGEDAKLREEIEKSGGANFIDYDNGDFGISDDKGNVIARFVNGHIKTKNFDSEDINIDKDTDGLIEKTTMGVLHFINDDSVSNVRSNKTPVKIYNSNRLNISDASISNNWSSRGVVATKQSNGILVDTTNLQEEYLQKNQFVSIKYTAELTGTLYLGCRISISSGIYGHTGFGCYTQRNGTYIEGANTSPLTVNGKGLMKLCVNVEKGDIVSLVFYASKAINKPTRTTTLYSDVMVSYCNFDKFTPFDTAEHSLSQIKKGDVVEFAESAELKYFCKPNVKEIKCVCFGDSITGMFGNGTDYPTIIGEMSNIEAVNCGFSGSTITDHSSANYLPFSLNRLVDAIVNNDFSTQDAKADACGGYYPEHLQNLKSVDFYKVDICTILIGTNDWGFNKLLRSTDDSSTSNKHRTNVEDAISYVISQLLNQYPHLRIIVITPLWRNIGGVGNTETRTDSNFTPNSKGDYLYQFAEYEEKSAKVQNIEVVPLYWNMGINAVTADLYLSDGTHPTYYMRRVLANKIINVINK